MYSAVDREEEEKNRKKVKLLVVKLVLFLILN